MNCCCCCCSIMYLSFSLACNLDPQCKVARWKCAHTIGTPLAGGVGTRLLSTAVVGAQEDPNDNYGGQISVKRDSTASLDKFGEQKKRRPVQVQDPASTRTSRPVPAPGFCAFGYQQIHQFPLSPTSNIYINIINHSTHFNPRHYEKPCIN